MNNIFNNQKGFALFYVAMLVLSVIIAASMSISFLTYTQQKSFKDIVNSTQAYYAAEAGVEDALLRIKNDMNWSSPYSFNAGSASVTNTIVTDDMSGAKIITGQGEKTDKTRKVSVVYELSTTQVSFYYGAQVGDGGMEMHNNSFVKGSIFSNASVTGGFGAEIDNSIIVAGNGNKIEELEIGDNAKAYSCIDCEIGGDFTYVTGGTLDNCDIDGFVTEQSEEIQSQDLPITQEKINNWKQEAQAGEVIEGNYTLEFLSSDSLGPAKVNGNVLIQNLSLLNLTGTVWVTGDLTLKNLSMIRLDSSYGNKSGLIVIDGQIVVGNGTWLRGSGTEGSYIMLLSTNDSLQESDPAIDVGNVSIGDGIFYASNGLVRLRNGVSVKELTGYKIYLDNNAEIDYESGLENTLFSSGPGASWQLISWQEIE